MRDGKVQGHRIGGLEPEAAVEVAALPVAVVEQAAARPGSVRVAPRRGQAVASVGADAREVIGSRAATRNARPQAMLVPAAGFGTRIRNVRLAASGLGDDIDDPGEIAVAVEHRACAGGESDFCNRLDRNERRIELAVVAGVEGHAVQQQLDIPRHQAAQVDARRTVRADAHVDTRQQPNRLVERARSLAGDLLRSHGVDRANRFDLGSRTAHDQRGHRAGRIRGARGASQYGENACKQNSRHRRAGCGAPVQNGLLRIVVMTSGPRSAPWVPARKPLAFSRAWSSTGPRRSARRRDRSPDASRTRSRGRLAPARSSRRERAVRASRAPGARSSPGQRLAP